MSGLHQNSDECTSKGRVVHWRECTNGDQKMQKQGKTDAGGALPVLPGPLPAKRRSNMVYCSSACWMAASYMRNPESEPLI